MRKRADKKDNELPHFWTTLLYFRLAHMPKKVVKNMKFCMACETGPCELHLKATMIANTYYIYCSQRFQYMWPVLHARMLLSPIIAFQAMPTIRKLKHSNARISMNSKP